MALATPHARGSTLPTDIPSVDLEGYPACAGIDLPPLVFSGGASRLPRMRGDRPYSNDFSWETRTATPHARGSTWT